MKPAYFILLAPFVNLPAIAGEFAAAPLNKPSAEICNHGVCAVFTLLNVLPMSNKPLTNGQMYMVVYKKISYGDDEAGLKTHRSPSLLLFNDVVFCSKSNPAHFSYNYQEGWSVSYLRLGDEGQQGTEFYSDAFYMAVCHNDLKFQTHRDPMALAHKLGYEFKADDPRGDDDLLETAVSPYQFIANGAKPLVAKPDSSIAPAPAQTPGPNRPAVPQAAIPQVAPSAAGRY